LNIGGFSVGAIKLPFRRLNFILCKQVGRDPYVGVKENGDFNELSDKKYLIEDYLSRGHLLIIKQRSVAALFATKLRRTTVIKKVKLMLIAAIAASSMALPAASLAQSAYSTPRRERSIRRSQL
jgi:hypothetical protein